MKRKKGIFFIVFLFTLFPCFVFAGNIVYPWRAAPAFALTGKSFHILYNNVNYTEIDSVVLVGPYNRVALNIDSVSIGRFEYDLFTKNDVNNKIWVKVPETAPEELYDLAVFSGGETHLSPKSVKVLREFESSHCFIHISDTHVSRQWEGTAENGYAKELELLDRFIEVANIINPDFVIVTGDVIMNYTDSVAWGGDFEKVFDADQRPLVEEKYKNYFEGAKEFSGIQALNAPVFSLPGNHDFYGVSRDDHLAKARQWNALCGKRVYGFSYGKTRVLAADDFLGDPVIDIPDSSPMSGLQGEVLESFLEETGPGAIRIMAQHRNDRIDTVFLDKHKIQILLHGDENNPFHEYVGATPTLSARPGTVCRSGELRDDRWKESLGFFRIFYIDGDKYEFMPPLRFADNLTDDYKELNLNLTLYFKEPNDGSSSVNEAVLKNHFPVNLPTCKVRFVMKKGDYQVEGGKVHQVIQTGKLTVIDVYTEVESNFEKTIKIYN